ncbi:hypothetical protein [Bacillus cereus]|nr:hypothetical protein [Bacillus cereus]
MQGNQIRKSVTGAIIHNDINNGSGANKGYITKNNKDSYRNRSLYC